jgi:hypothetical protein
MRKGTVLTFAIPIFCAMAVGAWSWSASSQSRINERLSDNKEESSESPLTRLKRESRAAKGNDPGSVDRLADAIITDFVPFEVPVDAKAGVKARLVQAELSYRKGSKGITESDIVRSINELAEKFGAPAYAKTSPTQVRYLRVSMMGFFPDLVAQEPIDAKAKARNVGSSINPRLSPLEATFLTGLMLNQKMINKDYQLEPKEWREHLHQRNLELWHAYHDNKGKLSLPASSGLAVSTNPKREEMRQVIARAASTMTSADISDLVPKMLDSLGVYKEQQ